ncbi:MAG: protein jag, partial [Minisyncoccia bacterium]
LKALVESLFNALDVRVDSVEVPEGPRTVVAVRSPDGQILIGPRGEVLQALNTLARRMAEAAVERMRPHSDESEAESEAYRSAAAPAFLIDVNGYHEAALEALRGQARLLAERARLFRHEIEMPPMSSYERLVVHELFADDPEIDTISMGEGKFRHIVLKYKTNASAAESDSKIEV